MPRAPREPAPDPEPASARDAATDVPPGAEAHDGPWPTSDSFTSGGPSITEAAPGVIRMDQASAADIRAQTVDMHQSAAGNVVASTVHSQQGAIGFVRGNTVQVQESAVGAVAAGQVEFRNGFALLVVARRVSGQATVLLDWRGVTSAVALLVVLGRLLRGRR